MRRKITISYTNPKSEQVCVIYRDEKYYGETGKNIITFSDPNPFTFKTGLLRIRSLSKAKYGRIESFENFNQKSTKYPTLKVFGRHVQVMGVGYEHDISQLFKHKGLIKSMIVEEVDTITNIDGIFKYLNGSGGGYFEIFTITQSLDSYTVFYKYLEKPKAKTFKNLIDF